MLLPRAVHVSSTFEFGAVFHDCLSEDPQGNPPFSPFFLAREQVSKSHRLRKIPSFDFRHITEFSRIA